MAHDNGRGCYDAYQSEPRKDQIEKLIEHLNMDPELAHEGMRASIDIVEMNRRVNCSEEGAVQPTTALRNEFRHLEPQPSIYDTGRGGESHLIRNVCDGICALDIVQDPAAFTLRDKLPA